MTTTTESSLEVNAAQHHARTACAKSSFHSLTLDAASVWSYKEKYTQFTVGSPGPIWHCRGLPNHDNDNGEFARGQCMNFVCKVDFSLLDPRCRLVWSYKDKTYAIHSWLSRAHLALPRAAKP
jgi:hypothetical protein